MIKLPEKIRTAIRDKAIQRATTRIILAGKTPEAFNEEELEIIVREEEDNIKANYKEKGLLGIAALLGLGWWL